MEFESLYVKVEGIVEKARKDYYLKLWERDDWHQEGMLVLYELLERHPELAGDLPRLYVYYKVKFRNYIKDKVRRQESQKRKFDRMAHEEIGGLSHLIGEKGLQTDDRVALHSLLEEYKTGLDASGQDAYEQLISGQRFKGRRQMLRELQAHLKDFG